MFRGRPIRRLLRRALPVAPPPVPPLLLEANRLLANGNYPAAAEALEQLAQKAEARHLPQAAPLYLQAGRARILAGQTAAGMKSLRSGLALLARTGRWAMLQRMGERAVAELSERGLKAEAQEIAAYLQSLLPSGFTPGQGGKPVRQPLLPTHCPACGAPVRPNEVDWIDEWTAECPYCGSPIRGET
jgi:hypothetical protein